MKLVFYGGGDANDNRALDRALLDMCGKSSPHMCLIPSQSYESEIDFSYFVKQYRRYGVKSFLHFPIDVKFDHVILDEALHSDIIHLGGGNTFYFLTHLRKSGMMPKLKAFVKRGGILTGLSAGAIMMTPTITTASFPPFDCDDNDDNVTDFKSLKLVNFDFFPHYVNSPRYKSAMIAHTKKTKIPLLAAPNGSGLVICDKQIIPIRKIYQF